MQVDKTYTWEDITISQFNQILAISGMQKSELEKSIMLMSVIDGKDEDYYEALPINEFMERVKLISFIGESSPKERFKGGKYEIAGRKFTLTKNAKKMTTGQFIDYQSFIESKDIASLCAIFLIPNGKKYGEDYDFDEVRELINEHFKIVDAMGISFFFLKMYESLSNATLRYLCKKLKKETKKNRDPEKINLLKEAITRIELVMYGSV